jgi:transcriptional regulator with XRE-family HTH domain
MKAINEAGPLIRSLRHEAGLTQQQLAGRMGTTQSAVATLEKASSNPTLRTLADAVDALGYELILEATPKPPGVDESLIRQHLELSPAERLRQVESMAHQARELALAGARARGELA